MPIFLNDVQLLRGYRAGHRSALRRVYQAYRERVERFLRAGAPADLGAGDLEDLVQEVFIRAFGPAARLGYDGRRRYDGYLLGIARNVRADWRRRFGREIPTGAPDLHDSIERSRPAEDPSLDPRTRAALERLLAALPPELRAIHELRFGEGLSQRDAALALGIGRQVLRTLEARLAVRLREALEPPAEQTRRA